MQNSTQSSICRSSLLALGFGIASVVSALGGEKPGMPDLSQEDQTCLPTSTANLIVWFGHHGYPKLIAKGDDASDGYIHTIHGIMNDTAATYQTGTRTDAITYGIDKYIHDAGYNCDVEYRGLDWSQARFSEVVADQEGEKYKKNFHTPLAFSQDWLQENNDPQKGFILLLAYCKYDSGSNTFTDAINAGHAVTLVNAATGMLLIHDPAHESDEPGRKILTPELLTGGTFDLPGYHAPVAGLMLLSGSLLEAPPDAGVILTGAVCITMKAEDGSQSLATSATPGPNAVIGTTSSGSGGNLPMAPASAPTRPVAPAAQQGWAAWLFDSIFKK